MHLCNRPKCKVPSRQRFHEAMAWQAWQQLLAAWLTFVVTASVYHVPATLLGGTCPNSTQPCSISEEFPSSNIAVLGWLPSMFLLIKGVLALPAGLLMERIGVRACMITGGLLLLLATTLYASAFSFVMLLASYVLFGCAYCLSGLIPLLVLINEWFQVNRKASAIGLMLTGYAVSGMLWPVVAASIAERHGWRAAASLVPCAVLFIALPLMCFVVRDGPYGAGATGCHRGRQARLPPSNGFELQGDTVPVLTIGRGAMPYKDAPSCRTASTTAESPCDSPYSTHAAAEWVWDPTVWSLLGMCVLTLYIVNGTQHMLVTFLSTEAGLTLSEAGAYSSLTFLFSFAGKALSGFALDSSHKRLFATCSSALLPIGGALLLRPVWHLETAAGDAHDGARFSIHPAHNPFQLACFVIVYGTGYGATFTLVQSRAAQLYGSRHNFATLQSALAVGQYGGSFLGTLITSQLRNALGSFVVPFLLFPLLGLINCLLCIRVFHQRRLQEAFVTSSSTS
ncbi:hypothetical protein AB1Y20_000267 [Prymnesium parvum]|uniref:Major facilitator superfamily (MFS) profile domain-containing protein n=1 Tax=Prymnesium parvum TaxID=97485 RepID=A0AB34K7Q0_PRYPA